ncbi:hypothetical protein WISP_89071 [Willisornis vidua]|uniref:VGLL3 protein n=1 Tax=Willisornis vidua TaxID=1566151 RepID=A0ABQ9D761_9PASS|nr:hypothetical protein WISP_89071 [Willisornis vidua]
MLVEDRSLWLVHFLDQPISGTISSRPCTEKSLPHDMTQKGSGGSDKRSHHWPYSPSPTCWLNQRQADQLVSTRLPCQEQELPKRGNASPLLPVYPTPMALLCKNFKNRTGIGFSLKNDQLVLKELVPIHKSRFPYFAKRQRECVPVIEYECVSVSGEDLCLREGRAGYKAEAKKKLAVYNKMQESLEVTLPSKQEEDEKDQPAEMEYLNSRCVLFTYFQGDIGSVVDEHFSRALSQASSFNSETALTKSKTGLSPLWRGAFTATTAAFLNGLVWAGQGLPSPHNSCTKILRRL